VAFGSLNIIDRVREIEGFQPHLSIVEYTQGRGLVERVLIGYSSRGVAPGASRWCGLVRGCTEAVCQGIVEDEWVCLRVGGEKKAVGG
jgi:hypothetical protein